MNVDFNTFVYFSCMLACSVACLLLFLDKISKKSASSQQPYGANFGLQNQEFRTFQNQFLAGYLPCLFADSLQAPYLYYLYHSYGFLENQIAVLYVTGFVTNVFVSVLTVYLVQRAERRGLCLLFVGLNSVSCFMKLADSYGILLLSRVLDGVASSLLTTPFQEWYVYEHAANHDFPKEWIPSTFQKVAMATGALSVVAGLTAELSESAFKITALPFLLAIPCMLMGGFFIQRNWNENRLEYAVKPKFWPQFRRGLKAIVQQPNVFLLTAVQALFESCIYMFVFLWTPLFLYLKSIISTTPSFGAIYAAFMASVLCGTLLHRLLRRKVGAVYLLCLSAGVAFVAMALTVTLTYPTATTANSSRSDLNFRVLFWVLCTFELAVGLYFGAVQRLQKDVLPREDRAAILSLFRWPLNTIAAAGLLLMHGREEKEYGNWVVLCLAAVLLLFCLMASLMLQALLTSRPTSQPNLDHFVLKLDGTVDEPSDDEGPLA